MLPDLEPEYFECTNHLCKNITKTLFANKKDIEGLTGEWVSRAKKAVGWVVAGAHSAAEVGSSACRTV